MAKLGEVCLLKAGKFVSANDISPEYNKGLYPCFGGNGIRGYVADYTHDGEFPLIGRQGALCGNVNLASGKFHATEHAVVVQPKIEMNVHWLYYALNAMNLGQYATGAAQPGLAVSKLETLSIEIPNISEQNKIAQTLYKVEQLVNFRKQQLAKLDELVKARFVEMFENVTEENALENLCHFIDYRGKTPEKSDSGLPFITAKNIRMHYMSFDTQEFISKENYDKVMTRGIPKVGDVVFTTEAPLGNVCRIPQFDTDFYIGQRIITMQTKLLNPVYLEYALSSDDFKRKLVGKSSGSTVTGIRSKLLGKLTIPVPSKGLQNQFAAFVERVDKQKQTVQQSLEKLELMKKALMQEYFG